MNKLNDFQKQLLKQQEDIRKRWKLLAKIYPGCFDKSGKPIVAELRLPY